MSKYLICIICVCMVLSGCQNNSNIKESSQGNYMERSSNETKRTIEEDKQIELSIVEGTLSESSVQLSITNHTNEEISYGWDYLIQQEVDGVWYEMNNDFYSLAIGVMQKGNSTRNETVEWTEPLDHGHYRILKPFCLIQGEAEVWYAVEFNI